MVLIANRDTLVIVPPTPLRGEATTPRGTLAGATGRMSADPFFRQAFEADPWLALACYDLIRRPAGLSLGGG